MENPNFAYLTIRGDISIKPATFIPYRAVVYIIMGPTGAGKSTFIEALAGDSQNLAISGDQLAGFTQRLTAYELVNVTQNVTGAAVYLVDTPGFSDSKISEIEVMEMLKVWLKENCPGRDSKFIILFLTPITVTRLPGGRQRTIEMLRESMRGHSSAMTVATTMWDTLHSEQTRSRAERNFEQLRDKVYKGFFGYWTSNLKRFTGTRTSALLVMDSMAWNLQPFKTSTQMSSTLLYCDLHERIEGALQKKVMIESELAYSNAPTNKIFKDILEQAQKENDETLAKFISQFVKFGTPPHEFREAAQGLRKTILANIVPTDRRMRNNFRQWAKNPTVDNELVSDPKLTERILAMLVEQHTAHQPSWNLDFIEPFRRLLKST